MSDPQALHAALLGWLDEFDKWTAGDGSSPSVSLYRDMQAASRGLRVAVELHKPVPCTYSRCSSPQTHRVCAACGPSINSPCRTVWVIGSALGVSTDG